MKNATIWDVVSRRRLLTVGASGFTASLLSDSLPFSALASLPSYTSRTVDLVQHSTVVDMLGLWTLDYRKLCSWQTATTAFPQAEFDRLKASGVTVIHPAVG